VPALLVYNALMKPQVSATLLLLAAAHLSAADPKWIRMKSEHFEMYSSAGERATRDTLKSFEQVRSFFQEAIGIKEEKPIPVRLVAFNSVKEYEPYSLNEAAVAYYMPGADGDTIVMSHTGIEARPMAVHEYTHLVLEHAGLTLPPWLNEGLAEIFSTLRPSGNKVMIGEIIQNRRLQMLNSPWVPLATILVADHNSPFYNEKNKAGSLYDEGWALTHMLMLDERYSAKFDQVIRTIQSGTSSPDALSTIYGMPLSEIDKDLQGYIRGSRFYARLYPTKLEKVTDELAAEPAPDYDVKLILIELSSRKGQDDETRKKLEALTVEDPKRPEPYSQLGYLVWRQGKQPEAREFFAKAYALGDRSRRMLWDYGRMNVNDRPTEATRALGDLLEQEPGRVEVRIALAEAQLRNHQPGVTVATLTHAKSISAADAPRLFLVAAYAYIDLKNMDEAKANVDKALKYSKSERDKGDVQRLQDYLQRVSLARGNARSEAPQIAAEAIAPPSRRAFDEPTTKIFPDKPSAEGTFTSLLCGEQAKIVLKTTNGDKIFVIEDPRKIVVVGKDGGKTDLNCGDQQPVPMRIEYDPAQPGTGIEGAVRILYFK
jgi:tetratricopeptide (TPR) repeat protein